MSRPVMDAHCETGTIIRFVPSLTRPFAVDKRPILCAVVVVHTCSAGSNQYLVDTHTHTEWTSWAVGRARARSRADSRAAFDDMERMRRIFGQTSSCRILLQVVMVSSRRVRSLKVVLHVPSVSLLGRQTHTLRRRRGDTSRSNV